MLSTSHELESGMRVRLRLTKPSDRRLIARFLAGISARSLQLRFGETEDGAIDENELCFYDPRERLVVAAAGPGETSLEEIVGIADVTLMETGVAEIGLLVDDAHQTAGIGKLLSEAIAQLALRRGASHLRAPLAEPNPAVDALLERIGPTVKVVENGEAALYARLPAARGRKAA